MDTFIYPSLTKNIFQMFFINVWLHKIKVPLKTQFDFLHFLMISRRHRIPRMTLLHFCIFITVRMVQSCAFLSYPLEWVSSEPSTGEALRIIDRYWWCHSCTEISAVLPVFILHLHACVMRASACVVTREWGTRTRKIRSPPHQCRSSVRTRHPG